MFRGHHPPKDPYLSDLLLIDNVIPGGGSGVLARTELVRSVGGFDVSLSAFADWDLNIRLSHRSAIASLDRPLVGNYVHPDQIFATSLVTCTMFRGYKKSLHNTESLPRSTGYG